MNHRKQEEPTFGSRKAKRLQAQMWDRVESRPAFYQGSPLWLMNPDAESRINKR